MEAATQHVIDELCAMHLKFGLALEDPYYRGLILVFCSFSNILVQLSHQHPPAYFKPLFDYLEDRCVNGTQQVQDAVATCLCESLQNAADREPEHMRPYMQLPGAECRAYCQAIDAVDGITRIAW